MFQKCVLQLLNLVCNSYLLLCRNCLKTIKRRLSHKDIVVNFALFVALCEHFASHTLSFLLLQFNSNLIHLVSCKLFSYFMIYFLTTLITFYSRNIKLKQCFRTRIGNRTEKVIGRMDH